MTDVLDDAIRDIRKRLEELEPAVQEHARLKRALESLESADRGSRSSGATRRTRASGRNRRARRRSGPTRADQFVELVAKNPGVTVTQAAKDLGMTKPNALYTVARQLTQQRKVHKRGSGYHPAGAGKK